MENLTHVVAHGVAQQPRKTFLIGIHGAIGSGKDTSADFLSLLVGASCYSLATPLKVAASHVFGVDIKMFNTHEGKETFNEYWGMTHRDMLRKFGNDALKPIFGDDIWIKRAKLMLQKFTEPSLVIRDIRFPYEAEWVREHGVMLHIKRPGNPYEHQMSEHSSDQGLEVQECDFIVDNSSAKSFLYDQLMYIILQRKELRDLLDNDHFKNNYVQQNH